MNRTVCLSSCECCGIKVDSLTGGFVFVSLGDKGDILLCPFCYKGFKKAMDMIFDFKFPVVNGKNK